MAVLFTACGAKAPLSKEQAVKFADKDVLCLVNKDYEAVASGFNESIAKQVDATALQQAWESVVSTAGGLAMMFIKSSVAATVIMFGIVIVLVIVPMVYSYFEFQKEKGNNKDEENN